MRSQNNCELLSISVKDLERMKYEFNHEYNTLFDNKVVRLNNILKLKILTIKHCNEALKHSGVLNERGILTLPDNFIPECQNLSMLDSISLKDDSASSNPLKDKNDDSKVPSNFTEESIISSKSF